MEKATACRCMAYSTVVTQSHMAYGHFVCQYVWGLGDNKSCIFFQGNLSDDKANPVYYLAATGRGTHFVLPSLQTYIWCILAPAQFCDPCPAIPVPMAWRLPDASASWSTSVDICLSWWWRGEQTTPLCQLSLYLTLSVAAEDQQHVIWTDSLILL